MAIREIVKYPDPRVKTVCRPSDNFDKARQVVRDLIDTMEAGPPRTVGIAAPQIGELIRIVVVDAGRNPKYESQNGLLVLINPVIVFSEGEMIFREGCMSVPDYTANVKRSDHVVAEALGAEGQNVRVDAKGFEAVVLQHEIDHLDGILFLDRVANKTTDLFLRKRK